MCSHRECMYKLNYKNTIKQKASLNYNETGCVDLDVVDVQGPLSLNY